MNIYLAAPANGNHCKDEIAKSPFVLESYYYFQDWEKRLINDDFLLDSGAFTFLNSSKNNINWNEYVKKYAEFINTNDIKLFFELDIDSIVGIKEVERLRYKLEELTNKRCIPVWHKSRGKEYYLQMVKEYNYVSIGGIVNKEIKPKEYKYLPWFIRKAHEQGCKVHGLGFTNLRTLSKYSFDSVDSSSWTSGRRFGSIYEFKNGMLNTHRRKNHRIGDYKRADVHNIREWIKFQHYAKYNL